MIRSRFFLLLPSREGRLNFGPQHAFLLLLNGTRQVLALIFTPRSKPISTVIDWVRAIQLSLRFFDDHECPPPRLPDVSCL